MSDPPPNRTALRLPSWTPPQGGSYKTHAKLNLSLNVVGKRADGYHLLHSVVAFCDVGDEVAVARADTLSLAVGGRFGGSLADGQNNLVMRAASSLQRLSGVRAGARITLTKHLPVASGIGGGSGDAAAALVLLRALWNLDLSDAQLAATGAALGADIPVCLYGRACVMEGIGHHLTPLGEAFPELYAVLVNPLQELSTAAVFGGLQPGEWTSAPVTLTDWKEFRNDLTPSAMRLCPRIGEMVNVIARTPHCIAARLSGSGATCFGLYADPVSAKDAAALLQAAFPGYWVGAGRLR